MLEQAIRRRWRDGPRRPITAYLKSNTFKTIIGEVDIRNQKLNRFWTVGQWQDGFFQSRVGSRLAGKLRPAGTKPGAR